MPREGQTDVQALIEALRSAEPLGLRELSVKLHIRERELPYLLEKAQLAARKSNLELEVLAARCTGCGFEFSQRERFSRPSRCPQCKSERIWAPRFRLTPR